MYQVFGVDPEEEELQLEKDAVSKMVEEGRVRREQAALRDSSSDSEEAEA